MAFAGLWRVTESPSIARYLDSGKERKRVLESLGALWGLS